MWPGDGENVLEAVIAGRFGGDRETERGLSRKTNACGEVAIFFWHWRAQPRDGSVG
jgi:hypothetical protein